MPNKPCLGCGTEVSVGADSCPQCGRERPHFTDDEIAAADRHWRGYLLYRRIWKAAVVGALGWLVWDYLR